MNKSTNQKEGFFAHSVRLIKTNPTAEKLAYAGFFIHLLSLTLYWFSTQGHLPIIFAPLMTASDFLSVLGFAVFFILAYQSYKKKES